MKQRFSLQRILELKERREQAAAARLAEARSAAELARQTEKAVEAMRKVGFDRRRAKHSTTARVGELQNLTFILDNLEQHLEEVRASVRQADAKVDAAMSDFTEASRERQVLDRLKEKKREAALMEEADMDRKTMDDLALTRFVQGEKPSEGSEE